jgi:hypothetical protein
VQHDGAAQLVLPADALEVIRLAQGARETIENKAVSAIRLADAVAMLSRNMSPVERCGKLYRCAMR